MSEPELRLTPSLIQEGETDYALAPGIDEVWIKIDNLILHIVKGPDGLLTETFREETTEESNDEPAAFSYTTFGETEPRALRPTVIELAHYR